MPRPTSRRRCPAGPTISPPEGQILPLLDPSVETLAPASDADVISADKVDILDVQVALAAGQGAQLTLADGTQLSAKSNAAGSRQQIEAQGHVEVDGLVLDSTRSVRWDVVRLP